MTQVSFYTLGEEGLDARILFACRLTDKAWKLGHRVFIQTQSTEQAKRLDDMLNRYTLPREDHIPLPDAVPNPAFLAVDTGRPLRPTGPLQTY